MVWNNLFRRKESPWYKHIPDVLCERWAGSYENFLADMGECPPKYSIDRIDNSKGYEPGNCRWATIEEQNNNKTNNRYLSLHGVTQTMAQWARETGIGHSTIWYRIDGGWTVERALTTPVQR